MDYFYHFKGDPTSPFWRRSTLGFLWKEWCWGWNSSTSATSCEDLTHWKRLWCWEGLRVGGEGDDRGWDGWMASLTRWTWVWVNSGSWWWTGKPGMLWFMGSQRAGHDWATELNRTELNIVFEFLIGRFFSNYGIYNCFQLAKQIVSQKVGFSQTTPKRGREFEKEAKFTGPHC